MRIHLDSIGCRLNISEIEELGRAFAQAGHTLVGAEEMADLYLFNSCTVTHTAARKSRQAIRQMRRANPQARLVVTGCYAHLEPDVIRQLGVDLVVDNIQKENLPALLAERGWLPEAVQPPPSDQPLFSPERGDHTRAFVKVQDGCDNRCAFCIVTLARGGGRSRPIQRVVAEVRRLVRLGYQEAVLSGVHLGSYGHDWGERQGLRQLIRAVLAETDLPRLRLSSLEPWDISPDLFELWQNPRLLPHLHLPLQSGCEATLRRMGRRTDRTQFAELVETARRTIPDLSITTDIIVGFPGETEAEFAESLAFVEAMAFARLHIFRYSQRPGTAAARSNDQVPGPIRQERSRRMHALNEQLERAFRRRFVGRVRPVLWESQASPGHWSGLADNYLRVMTHAPPQLDLHNRIVETELLRLAPAGLVGRLAAIDQKLTG